MATPDRTAAVEAMRGLRKAEIAAGPAQARVSHHNKDDEPEHKMGNLPPVNEYAVGPGLGKTVVLAGPGSQATGRNAFKLAWEAYNKAHLAGRKFPEDVDPRKGPNRGKRTRARRHLANTSSKLLTPAQEGTNVRGAESYRPRHTRGGSRRRAKRRGTRRTTRRAH